MQLESFPGAYAESRSHIPQRTAFRQPAGNSRRLLDARRARRVRRGTKGVSNFRSWGRVGLTFVPNPGQDSLCVVTGLWRVIEVGCSLVVPRGWTSRFAHSLLGTGAGRVDPGLGLFEVFAPPDISVSGVSGDKELVVDGHHSVFLGELPGTLSNKNVGGDSAERKGLTAGIQDQLGEGDGVSDFCAHDVSTPWSRRSSGDSPGTAPQAPLLPRWSTMVASHSTMPSMLRLLPNPALVISLSSRHFIAASTASGAVAPALRNLMPTRAALFGMWLAADWFMPAAEGGLLAASFQMDLFVGCTVIAGASMDEDGAQGLLAMLPQASHEAITMATWWFLPMGSHGGRWLLAIGGSETGGGYRRGERVAWTVSISNGLCPSMGSDI